ncbi:MAG: solute:sodium symporter family transporter [Clostridiales bacterium]|nr:solute:sodium symporter family transporter [Clostridiales bacterium]
MFIVITFILFTALVAVIAAVKTREENLDTQDGYFLAGRSLTGPVIAGSLMLTNLSTEQLVGQAGQTYATNMGPMAWESTSCVALILLAFVFVPRYLKMGLTTIPEFLEQRYDSGLRKLITLLLLLGYLLTYLPTVLYSGALVFNQIFDISGLLHVSELQGVTITATAIGIVGAIYAIFGGLKAVAVSDTINGIGLIIGGIALPVITVCAFGHGSFVDGIHNFINLIPAEKFNAINPANAQAPMIPWPVLFTGMVVNNLFYWATNQAIIQRALGAKNLAEAQKGAIYAAALKIITPLFIAICGLLVFYMAHNGLLSGDQVAALEKTSDLAYPTLIITMLPKPLLGFFAAVLFGAILSSFNSALNSCVTLYTLDLHRPLFNPNASDEYLVRIGKRFGIVLAIISICIAPVVSLAPSGLYDFLQSCFGFFNVPILATVIIGMFTKYTPPIAPKAGLILHVVLYSLTKTPLFPIHCHYLYVLFFLFVFQIAFQLIMGKVRPTAQPYVMKDAQVVDMAPWKHGKKAAIICIVLMLALYTLFSPIGLAG